MKLMLFPIPFAALATLGLTCACHGSSDTDEATLRLGLAVKAVPGVAALRYEATPVDCASGAALGSAQTARVDLLDFALPEVDGLPSYDGQHPFTDALFTLEPGCYDVSATPLDERGQTSSVCASAEQKAVVVAENVTTEILLVSQCNGRLRGALDGVGVVNAPPAIRSVGFEPSAFVACQQVQRVCATASDPDGDPLEFQWAANADNPSNAQPLVVSQSSEDATVTECAELVPTAEGDYQLALTVFDRAFYDGSWQRIENILANLPHPEPSRDETELTFHADCADAP